MFLGFELSFIFSLYFYVLGLGLLVGFAGLLKLMCLYIEVPKTM